jgi:hypothetical protein
MAILRMMIDRLASSALAAAPRPIDREIAASGTDAVAPIRGIDTMTRRTTKEILLEVSAGRERQKQSRDDPVKHGDAAYRFYSLRHRPTSPRASIKARRTIGIWVGNDQGRRRDITIS